MKSAGNGLTSSTPWRSLADVNTHAPFQPGDQILFKRASACKGRLHPKGNGASGAPITIGAYGTGAKPTIAGGGTSNFTGAVQLLNQQWWTIQDLHVTNTGGGTSTQTYRSGVSLWDQDGGKLPGIVIQRLTVDHVASAPNEKHGSSREWGGITVAAGGIGGDSFPNLMIRNNLVSHVGRSGIAVMNWEYPKTFNDGLRITGNRVSHARGDSIVVFGARHARIDHNTVDHGNDEWPCPLCGGISSNTANAGIWPARSADVLIDHNEVYGMYKLGGDGEAFDADANTDHVVFEDNYAHDNQGGGIIFCGSTNAVARFNILQNNKQSALTFYSNMPAKNTSIYNNTIYSRAGNDAKVVRTFGELQNTVKGVSFFNNIIVTLDVSGWYLWPTTPKSAANTYIGIHGLNEPADMSKGFDNPGLLNPGSGKNGFSSLGGYKTKHDQWYMAGSPIPKSVTTDFFGKRINPAKPPRGAAG